MERERERGKGGGAGGSASLFAAKRAKAPWFGSAGGTAVASVRRRPRPDGPEQHAPGGPLGELDRVGTRKDKRTWQPPTCSTARAPECACVRACVRACRPAGRARHPLPPPRTVLDTGLDLGEIVGMDAIGEGQLLADRLREANLVDPEVRVGGDDGPGREVDAATDRQNTAIFSATAAEVLWIGEYFVQRGCCGRMVRAIASIVITASPAGGPGTDPACPSSAGRGRGSAGRTSSPGASRPGRL